MCQKTEWNYDIYVSKNRVRLWHLCVKNRVKLWHLCVNKQGENYETYVSKNREKLWHLCVTGPGRACVGYQSKSSLQRTINVYFYTPFLALNPFEPILPVTPIPKSRMTDWVSEVIPCAPHVLSVACSSLEHRETPESAANARSDERAPSTVSGRHLTCHSQSEETFFDDASSECDCWVGTSQDLLRNTELKLL